MLLPELMDDMMEISRAKVLNHSESPDAGRCREDGMLTLPRARTRDTSWSLVRETHASAGLQAVGRTSTQLDGRVQPAHQLLDGYFLLSTPQALVRLQVTITCYGKRNGGNGD
jgi:hypothetical protein